MGRRAAEGGGKAVPLCVHGCCAWMGAGWTRTMLLEVVTPPGLNKEDWRPAWR